MTKQQHAPTLSMIEIPGGTQYKTPPDRIHGTVFHSGTDKVFARCPSAEDARSIVRAVNNHQALVEALEAVESLIDFDVSQAAIIARRKIQAALRQAKGD